MAETSKKVDVGGVTLWWDVPRENVEIVDPIFPAASAATTVSPTAPDPLLALRP